MKLCNLYPKRATREEQLPRHFNVRVPKCFPRFKKRYWPAMNSTDDTLVKVYLKDQLESDYICKLVPIIFYTEMSVFIDQQGVMRVFLKFYE